MSAPSGGPTANHHDRILPDQRERWLRGERVFVESYQASHPTLASDPERLLDLIYNEVDLRERLGEGPGLDEYVKRFPTLEVPLRDQFEIHRLMASRPGLVTLANTRGTGAAGVEDATVGSGQADGHGPAPPGQVDGHRLAPAGYEVLGELGRGGMGVVYKARQVGLNRVVALKTVLVGLQASQAQQARFRSEAEAVARLQHPNVVQVFDVGEHEGYPFLAMEYVAGGSLADRLDGTPLPPRAAAVLTQTLASAVHAAHRAGVIHRDLKPANILATDDGTPKITDFGLAKRLDTEEGHSATGDILGTPSYMSPEQAEGRVNAVSPATDVYALGSILHELLTGRPAFKAATPHETVRQVMAMEPVPPRRLQPGVPRELETVCLKCLEKSPERRYSSAEALAEDLGRFLAGGPIRARPVRPATKLWMWCRRRPALAGLSAGLAASLLAGFVGVFVMWRNAEYQRGVAVKQTGLQAIARRDTQKALARVEAINTFLTRDLLEMASPERTDRARQVTVKEMLDRSAATLQTTFSNQPEVEAALRRGSIPVPALASPG
jgi:predicted Ser/Thr protein kinase